MCRFQDSFIDGKADVFGLCPCGLTVNLAWKSLSLNFQRICFRIIINVPPTRLTPHSNPLWLQLVASGTGTRFLDSSAASGVFQALSSWGILPGPELTGLPKIDAALFETTTSLVGLSETGADVWCSHPTAWWWWCDVSRRCSLSTRSREQAALCLKTQIAAAGHSLERPQPQPHAMLSPQQAGPRMLTT